jgi:ABC-type phosphate transport system substrate-binding protein
MSRSRLLRRGFLAWGVWLGLLALPAGPVSAGEAEGYQLVVNASNPSTVLSRTQVSAMFLRKVTRWDHGGQVLPVDLSPNSPVREIFTKDVHAKTVAAVRGYWTQLVFSGRGVPLPEKSSDTAVIAFVRSNPGAVGYVSLKASVTDVKVVRVE